MWVFSEIGFFSTVQHDKYQNSVLVRARYRGDLERLRERLMNNKGAGLGMLLYPLTIHDTPRADYPYRMRMPKWAWARAVETMGREISYTNFKSHCHKSLPVPSSRHVRLMNVWSAMRGEMEETDWEWVNKLRPQGNPNLPRCVRCGKPPDHPDHPLKHLYVIPTKTERPRRSRRLKGGCS
jgi:hypothetical protein